MQLETFLMFLFIQVLLRPLAGFIFIIKTFKQLKSRKSSTMNIYLHMSQIQ